MTAVRAAQEMDALADAMSQWFNFFNGYDPAFTAAVPKPYGALTRRSALTPGPSARRLPGCQPVRAGAMAAVAAGRHLPARTKGRSSAIRSAATACSRICAAR